MTLDVDSFQIEVDGHQPGAKYNGHYGGTIFHPLIATAAELGDILDIKLRPGTAHTAEGPLLRRRRHQTTADAAVMNKVG